MKALHIVLLFTLSTFFLSASAIKCHVCESTSAAGPSCTDTDLGEVEDRCRTCGIYKLGDNQFRRECQSMFQEDYCGETQDEPGEQVCVCNSDLCNGKFVSRPTIRCHVCQPGSPNDASCTDTDLGEVQDGCGSCMLWKVAENRYYRVCSDAFANDYCGYREYYGFICECKTDLCNAKNLYKKSTVKCYLCNPESVANTSCNARNSGKVHYGCLSCSTSLTGNGITTRGCMDDPKEPSTFTADVKLISYCNTDLCNGEGEEMVDGFRSSGLGLQETLSSRVLIVGVMASLLGLARYFECQT